MAGKSLQSALSQAISNLMSSTQQNIRTASGKRGAAPSDPKSGPKEAATDEESRQQDANTQISSKKTSDEGEDDAREWESDPTIRSLVMSGQIDESEAQDRYERLQEQKAAATGQDRSPGYWTSAKTGNADIDSRIGNSVDYGRRVEEGELTPVKQEAGSSDQEKALAGIDYMNSGGYVEDSQGNELYKADGSTYDGSDYQIMDRLNNRVRRDIEGGDLVFDDGYATDGLTWTDLFFTTVDDPNNLWAQQYGTREVVDQDGNRWRVLSEEGDAARRAYMQSVLTDPEMAGILGSEANFDNYDAATGEGVYFPTMGNYYTDDEAGIQAFNDWYDSVYGVGGDTFTSMLYDPGEYASSLMYDDDLAFLAANTLGTTITDGDGNSYRGIDYIDLTGSGTYLGDLLGDDATDEEAAQLAMAYMLNEASQDLAENDQQMSDVYSGKDIANIVNAAYGTGFTRETGDGTHANRGEYTDDLSFSDYEDLYEDGGSLVDPETSPWFSNLMAVNSAYGYDYL